MRELSAIDALSVYEDALRGAPEGAGALHAVGDDGSRRRLPLGRWLGTPDAAEQTVLERAVGPVLDIGCGVGRHVVALRQQGVRAVGVEISPVATAIARERGAEVIQASAFEHPTTSEWKTILLLDGNIGIGGDATRLLRRAAALLVPDGTVLVELEEPAGAPRAQRVRLEGARSASTWIPWHFVGCEEIDGLAAAADFEVVDRWSAGEPLVRAAAPRRDGVPRRRADRRAVAGRRSASPRPRRRGAAARGPSCWSRCSSAAGAAHPRGRAGGEGGGARLGRPGAAAGRLPAARALDLGGARGARPRRGAPGAIRLHRAHRVPPGGLRRRDLRPALATRVALNVFRGGPGALDQPFVVGRSGRGPHRVAARALLPRRRRRPLPLPLHRDQPRTSRSRRRGTRRACC